MMHNAGTVKKCKEGGILKLVRIKCLRNSRNDHMEEEGQVVEGCRAQEAG